MLNRKKNKTILITGGAGFIGSHLVDELVKKNHRVVVVDKLYTGNKENLNPRARFFEFDVQNQKVFDTFKKEKPEIVYYLSGPINLRRRVDDPLFKKSLDILKSLKKILDWSCISGVRKFILVSSGGAIYSEAKIIPTPENHQVSPISLYGLANLILEKFLEEYSKIYNLNFSILRLSNVYGPRQWEEGIVPSFIVSLLKNKPPIINGNGRQTRDLIYIDDVIKAMLLAGMSEETGIFNVGSGQETTADELYKKVAEILNKRIKPRYSFHQNIGARRNALDCSKMKKTFNWRPKYSLEQGLRKTIRWFKNKNNENK